MGEYSRFVQVRDEPNPLYGSGLKGAFVGPRVFRWRAVNMFGEQQVEDHTPYASEDEAREAGEAFLANYWRSQDSKLPPSDWR
ncbi:hypothetical protein [Nocardioides sp. URHA0032]|uniref:hypothetical protein n=1 Tax=Nocardioides sp. URHA0032 TaxID=1380388 RepID=UPI0012DE4ED7|nr:hypothetical protein [Nocardioides sp. URHA0032]